MTAEAAASVLTHLASACAPTWGAAKPDKRALVFMREGCKLRVAVEALAGRKVKVLESWERTGTLLSVEAFMRIPAIERQLDPSMSDKDYAKLPMKLEAPLMPCVGGLVPSPSNKHYWKLEDFGSAQKMAEELARLLEPLAALATSSPLVVAAHAAHAAPELVDTALRAELAAPAQATPLSFLPTPCLVVALALRAAGDIARAKAAMAAFASRPDNLNASPNSMTGAGVILAVRFAIAQQIATALGSPLAAAGSTTGR